MESHPTAAITIADGEITNRCRAARAEARPVGRSDEGRDAQGQRLQRRRTGINEDAGRTRLTFRYRTRAWTVVVEPDGTVIERIPLKWMPRQYTPIA